jgi:Competence protein J (ComJ)
MRSFRMPISYSQVAVFDGRLEKPFNDWTDDHVRQGFSWRPGSVSFKTLLESGVANVDIGESPSPVLDPRSVRAISVPFSVANGAIVELATITESHVIPIGVGTYQLIYETGWGDSANWIHLILIPNGDQFPAVLVQDKDLSPSHPLRMSAEPA